MADLTVCAHGGLRRKCETCEAWAEVMRLVAVLGQIADADPTNLALDPTWAQRIARLALDPTVTPEHQADAHISQVCDDGDGDAECMSHGCVRSCHASTPEPLPDDLSALPHRVADAMRRRAAEPTPERQGDAPAQEDRRG